jgi:D-sedoheptulose 7-phosphate isomerase
MPTYLIDLDGTLCTNTFGEYEKAEPIYSAIARINKYYDDGIHIKIYTARGSGTGINWREISESQLQQWGVKYNELILGKPEADVIIDDKSIAPNEWHEASNDLSYSDYVFRSLLESQMVMTKATLLASKITNAAEIVVKSLKAGGKIIWCGNGGSAADSQHLAAELVGRFAVNRKALASIALTTDSSIITALGNDFGFETIFSRQIEALGKKGDVLIGISTSGESENVIEALKSAKKIGITTIGFTGSKKSKMEDVVDLCIKVPSETTSHIQTVHITIGQIICGVAENAVNDMIN